MAFGAHNAMWLPGFSLPQANWKRKKSFLGQAPGCMPVISMPGDKGRRVAHSSLILSFRPCWALLSWEKKCVRGFCSRAKGWRPGTSPSLVGSLRHPDSPVSLLPFYRDMRIRRRHRSLFRVNNEALSHQSVNVTGSQGLSQRDGKLSVNF